MKRLIVEWILFLMAASATTSLGLAGAQSRAPTVADRPATDLVVGEARCGEPTTAIRRLAMERVGAPPRATSAAGCNL